MQRRRSAARRKVSVESARMFEEKLLVGVASTCSTLAIVACLIVVPSLYQTINEIHNEVWVALDACREGGGEPWLGGIGRGQWAYYDSAALLRPNFK